MLNQVSYLTDVSTRRGENHYLGSASLVGRLPSCQCSCGESWSPRSATVIHRQKRQRTALRSSIFLMTEAEFVQAQVHEAWQQGREAPKIQDGQIPQTNIQLGFLRYSQTVWNKK